MKTSKPVKVNKDIIEELNKAILYVLYKTIFMPLKEALRTSKTALLENAELTPLEKSLKKGDIVYKDSYFTGKFNASISSELLKLGAIYQSNLGFFIPTFNIPDSILSIATKYNDNLNSNYTRTLQAIDGITKQKIDNTSFANKIESILNGLDKSIEASMKDIAVMPTLSNTIKKNIAKEYSENLKLYIKDFTDNEILKLRSETQELFLKGRRKSELFSLIKDRYNVSVNKAKFLATQEMSLLQSNFTAERYKDAGVEKIQWTRTTAKKPDPYHASLVGKIFSLNDLPIIDEKTGQRGLPGERYNCQCDMRAVVT